MARDSVNTFGTHARTSLMQTGRHKMTSLTVVYDCQRSKTRPKHNKGSNETLFIAGGGGGHNFPNFQGNPLFQARKQQLNGEKRHVEYLSLLVDLVCPAFRRMLTVMLTFFQILNTKTA